MKNLLLLISTILTVSLFGQRTTKFIFIDACTNQEMEIEFELMYFYTNSESDEVQDSTQIVKSGEPVTLENKLYLLLVNVQEGDWISTFYFNAYPELTSESDTLYLNKLRSNWNGLNHGSVVKYFYCDQQANGEIIERDTNGTIRATGTFENGTPTSNIKFFDQNGNLTEKAIYRNGNLVRTKKYRN